MISDHAKDSLIEISRPWWIKSDDYPGRWVVFDSSLWLTKWEDIALISDELESSCQITWIYNI